MRKVFICVIALILGSELAWSKPVYMRPNWPVATENLSDQELNEKILNEVESTWLYVETPSSQKGWVLQEDIISPFYFSKLVSLKENEELFLKPDFRSTPVRWTEKVEVVELMDQRGLWLEIKLDSGAQYWVKESNVEAYSKDPGVFYAKSSVVLRQKPINKSISMAEIPSGQKVQLKSLIKSQWAQIIYKGKVGFVPLNQLKSRLNVALKVRTAKGWEDPSADTFNQKIFELMTNPNWVGTGDFSVELKSSPHSQAKVVANLQAWSDLEVLSRKKMRWVQSHVSGVGEVWWEKDEKIIPVAKIKKLTNVRQIVRNPKSNVFFASANGLFKSLDGMEWEPVDDDLIKNQAISIARDGTLFVGEKLTHDQGKSFQPYIKWDNLVEQLTYIENIQPKHLGILKITPLDGSSQRLMLKLDVGDKKTVHMVTEDQGRNWKVVR